MKLSDFRIGLEFTTGNGTRFRCTDVGSRVIVAIDLNDPDDAVVYDSATKTKTMRQVLSDERPTWHRGPPYAVVEIVFDEYDLPACEPAQAPALTSPLTHVDRELVFDLVEAELRRLDVESVHFVGGVVTLTTREHARGEHWHGEAETLHAAFEELEQDKK